MSTLQSFQVRNYNIVSFDDERDRAPYQAPTGVIASITLSAPDGSETWGEFLQREDALALYGWLGLLLSQPAVAAPDAQPSSPGPTHTEQESE